MKEYILNQGWQISEREETGALVTDWIPARVPGTVHEALLAAGRIPDPFYGDNELQVQWIGERDWIYRCRFSVPAQLLGESHLVLRCEGLDTVAKVLLNGEPILASDNMFVPAEVDVRGRLLPDGNELHIVFSSPIRIAKEREASFGAMRVWNGDASRVYLRKAQYHFGWDWGPCLLTTGPYRPLRLLGYGARIRRVACPVEIDQAHGRATVHVSLCAEGDCDRAALALLDPSGRSIAVAEVALQAGEARAALDVPAPELWWPVGLGAQPLYQLSATLLAGADVRDRRDVRLGLRTIELCQEPMTDENGRSFHFTVNGQPIFCGGANWIPADSFLPRVDDARYDRLLRMAKDGNVNMLRVWGGGIYEEDRFYDLCDELGILVWQDFMFACGLYPAEDWFVRSVQEEAEAQINRLAHHACLALWCGNNEDYSIAASLEAFPPARRTETALPFPARKLYEDVLAAICAARDPQRPYWPGSPYSGSPDLDPSDGELGDRHTWDVWHGSMADYQDYTRYAGRFVSEFGMQALPALQTLLAVLPEAERRLDSAILHFHNKAERGPERLANYVERNLPLPSDSSDLAAAVYASQLMQAEALGWALRGFRRRFGGPGRRRTSGALIWQWNDCWPVVSWAVIDHALRPKASYYVVRRELQPLALGLALSSDGNGADLWAASALRSEVRGEILLRSFAPDGQLVASARHPVRLLSNQTTEDPVGAPPGGPLIHGVTLLIDGEERCRAVLFPEPLRALSLPTPGLSLMRLSGERLRLRSDRPAKGVVLEAGEVVFSDNALDLLPGDAIEIAAPGLGAQPISARWLGGESLIVC